jgi:hypothetical protein
LNTNGRDKYSALPGNRSVSPRTAKIAKARILPSDARVRVREAIGGAYREARHGHGMNSKTKRPWEPPRLVPADEVKALRGEGLTIAIEPPRR